MNKKALRLIELGLNPVLLGSEGGDLKRPILKGWQTAVYTEEDVRRWPRRNNIGIRCGRQRDSLPRASRGGCALIVFDFDEEAEWVFPAWWREAEKYMPAPPVIVASARGYHVYAFTAEAHAGRTLAGKYAAEAYSPGKLGTGSERKRRQSRKRLFKFIETLGRGRQVVSAGSCHPSGRRYRFINGARYNDIPTLDDDQYQALVALSRTFDRRPQWPKKDAAVPPTALTGELASVQNCLDYARHFMAAEEQVEANGDIRLLGHGGLLLTADGRGWYSFSDETGGGLAQLIAWHQALVGERTC